MQPLVAKKADPGEVLAKATVRSCQLLGLTGATLGRVLGVSPATVSRVLSGDKPIKPDSKEGELALLLVRVYRSVDALVGTDDTKRRLWMNSHNKALGDKPCKLVERADGLVATLNYLDGMRAPT